MRYLMAGAMIAAGAWMVTGCKGKSAQDALEGAQSSSPRDTSMASEGKYRQYSGDVSSKWPG